MATDVDVLILGAGGAGLFCALTAGRRGRRVAVLDHNDKPGKKLLISGGGRCNFTNTGAGPEHYRSRNPRFATSALARFSPADFIALVDRHAIPWHEKKLGQLFCDGPAKGLLQMLLDECAQAGAELHLPTTIDSVERTAEGFTVATSRGPYTCRSLVLATGGLSLPTIGATDLGYRIAKQFGLRLVETAPALVPFTLPADEIAGLSGVAVDAEVSCNGTSFRESILFTHVGLSGPAILQISTFWHPGETVVIDLLPDQDVAALLKAARAAGAKQTLANQLGDLLPRRLAQHLVDRHRFPDSVHHLSQTDLARIGDAIHRWPARPTGTEGYRKAEVTRGGIDTDHLSSKTMECRTVPGLYCIGEVVDVTGWLGGYNFQWAWASANAAGSVA